MKTGIFDAARTRLADPLRRSSDALIIGTGITSVLGFVFWALAARWLPTSAVGVGAALMSTVTLLANFATLGMRNGLLRFLPAAGAGTKRLVLTCYALCAGAAMLAAGIFLLGQPLWAEKLGFLRESPLTGLAFAVGTAVWVIFVLQDQVLIGFRRTGWVPIENGASSVLKIAALPLFATAAAWAVFAATIIPALLAVIFVSGLILRYSAQAAALDQRPAIEARIPIRQLIRFAASDHVATLLWFATTDVLTLIVLHVAGAEASAYWYIANTIGYSLYLVTSNVGSALIAESVHDPSRSVIHARKALLHSAQMVVPAAVIAIVATPFVLGVMGQDYVQNATTTLQLILASAIPQLIVGISVSTARVRGDMRTVLGVYVFTALSTWGGSWIGLELWGLTGIGIAIALNQTLVALYLLAAGRTGLWDGKRGWGAVVAAIEALPRVWRRRLGQRKAKRLLSPALLALGLSDVTKTKLLTSDSDTLVIEAPGETESRIIKIATSSAASKGLDRHAESAMHLVARLAADSGALVPRILHRSLLNGNTVLLESALKGQPDVDPEDRQAASRAALQAMSTIHDATSEERRVESELLDAWVCRPLESIRQGCRHSGAAESLDGLAQELRRAFLGRRVLTSLVHGDFWQGNVLMEQHSDGPRVSGIVDWENTQAIGLPDADLVHWWLTSRPLQMGEAVREALLDLAAVRCDLDSLGIALPNPQIKLEHVVLQAWLEHVSAGLNRATTNQVGRVWIARNVVPVVRLFDAEGFLAMDGGRR